MENDEDIFPRIRNSAVIFHIQTHTGPQGQTEKS